MTQNKKTTIFVLLAIIGVLLLCGLFLAHTVLKPETPPEAERPPTPTEKPPVAEVEIRNYADISELPMAGKQFLYLGQEGATDYLVDLAVPQVQIAVAHTQNSPDFTEASQYSVITISKNPDTGPEHRPYLLSVSYSHHANLSAAMQTAPGQAEAKTYAEEFMNSFVYSGNRSLAITGFTVNSATMEPLGKSGHIYSLSLNADVQPQKNAFQPQLGYLWGEPDAEDFVRNLNLGTILYYYNGKWGSCLHADSTSPFLTGIDYSLTVPKTEFSYKPVEVPWEQVWSEGKPLEQVFYEDVAYSYISHSTFQWTKENVLGEFSTKIEKLNRESGEKTLLHTMPVNHLFPSILLKTGNMALLDCASIEYPSGQDKGYLFLLDLVHGTYKEVLPFALPILVKENTVYAVCMEGNAAYEQGIYEIVFNEMGLQVKRLGALPGRAFSAQYEGLSVLHLDKATNTLYMLWPADTMELSPYAFDLNTGLSRKLE